MRISENEFGVRRATFAERLENGGLTGAALFDAQRITYYTGFAFVPTERPIAFVLSADGRCGLLLPRLELEHAEKNTTVDELVSYEEYPGERHPAEQLRDLFDAFNIRPPLGADMDGYPRIFGYRGPPLGDHHDIADLVEDQMAIKSEAEIGLLRESARWAAVAHGLLQRYTRPGLTESKVAALASTEATTMLLEEIGPLYRAQDPWLDGAIATYRGQIGTNAALPHTLSNNTVFRAGDTLVTGATAPVWGYRAELERTMIIGPPTASQREFFEHAVAVQDIAFAALRPGMRCAEVDQAVRDYYETHSLWAHWRHHTGHAIGLRYHEGPFLDHGDETEILPGMVFTIEPGLYDPTVGGFRHSDTVAITERGIDVLTEYPRDLENLTLPIH
jgi:Xaa-Pro aminopeptidase